MHTVLTAKLKLHTTPEQFRALRQTQLAYRDALNEVSRYAFAHGKMSHTVGLQDGTYQEIRSRFGLPAQMAGSAPRQVGATSHTLWTQVKANAAARAAGHTKKRYRGLDQAPKYVAPKYVAPTLTYQLGHDYGFKTGQQVSVLTLEGRVILSYTGYTRHVALLQHGARIGAAKLWYDQPRKPFDLLVSREVAVADPASEQRQRIVGVDVGQRYLAVATDLQNHTAFFPGAAARAKADHYARLRKRLQRKGTRSATRRLVVIAGRERRLKHERNHNISRQIVDTYPHSLIGLEDLTAIRKRAKRRHGKREEETAQGQSARLPVGLRGTAGLHRRQGAARGQHGGESGRLADEPGLPPLWVHRRGEPSAEGAGVQLHGMPAGPAGRLDRRAECCLENVTRSARLGEHGRLVSTP
jgi:predicted transposase